MKKLTYFICLLFLSFASEAQVSFNWDAAPKSCTFYTYNDGSTLQMTHVSGYNYSMVLTKQGISTNLSASFQNSTLEIKNAAGITTNSILLSGFQAGAPYDPCEMLGKKRSGENFDDCFKRNWNNFCCDFWGCAAQISNPYGVAIAIGILCGSDAPALGGGKIISIESSCE